MIKGFVGTYGSGKTLWLSKQAQWYFNHDLPVISNMPLWGYNKKKQKVLAKFIYNDEVFDFLQNSLFQDKLTLLVLDEASGIFDSYKFKQIPSEVFDMLKQSRKLKLDIFYTSQRHQDIATRVRDNSEIIYLCSQHFRSTPIHIYTAMGVQPYYFNDKAKSTELKRYIVKRRWTFYVGMMSTFKHFLTDFVVTSKTSFLRYKDKLGDPESLTPEQIIIQSKQHKDLRSPL